MWWRGAKEQPSADDADRRTAALDVLIEQERQLIARFEARQAKAESSAAAAMTAVLALAALTATAAQTFKHVDMTWAWTIASGLALAGIVALVARTVSGLRPNSTSTLSSRTDDYVKAFDEYRELTGLEGPVAVRTRVLGLCRRRADDAERAAERMEQGAGLASLALAVAVVTTVLGVLLM